jgi:hypothetical protein
MVNIDPPGQTGMSSVAQPASVASSSLNADISLINELYEEIERSPPVIVARKLLIQQCLQL